MIPKFWFKDVVNVASLWMMFEWSNKVTNIWRVQFNEFVLDVFQLFALQKFHVVAIVIIEQMFN